MTSADAIALIILLVILIAVGVYLLHWLYRHSSKDESFVRTGLGGERVVMGGGALVIPIVHNISAVNMNAIPIELRRTGEQSLTTRNKMRVDIVAEFSVRVIPTVQGISTAARALGERTRDPDQVRDVVQSRFVDALSAVAATMTMDEIHTNRTGFMKQVSAIAAGTLDTNGLELENSSLISLNQTDISVFNPANAFDAEGLTQLTEQIEGRRILRNKIENDARLGIKLKDYETEQRALQIDRDLEYARIDQTREIEIRKAVQQAEIENERSTAAIGITNAKIRAEQEGERLRIAKDKLVESERISSATEIKNLEIDGQKATELRSIDLTKSLEKQRIASRQEVEAERIENDRKVREFEIRTRQDLSIIETTSSAEVENTKLEKEQQVESNRISVTKVIEILAVEKDKEIRVNTENADAAKERAAIGRRHSVDQERIRMDEETVRLEIDKNETIKLAEAAARRKVQDAVIAVDRELDELRITAQKFVDRFEIERRKEVEITDKERLIAVINKSIEEVYASSKVAEAKRVLATFEEQIVSAKEEEAANRAKRVDLIEAESKVGRETMRLIEIAKAEKDASEQRALAEIAEANASAVRYAKDAEGQRKLNDAENTRSESSRRSAIYENLVKNLPSIIRETVKPMENIESIRILQVDGVPGINSPSETNAAGGGGGGGSGNMTDRVVNSAMKYRTQVAFVDGLMKDLGLPIESLGSAGGMSFRNFQETAKADKDGED